MRNTPLFPLLRRFALTLLLAGTVSAFAAEKKKPNAEEKKTAEWAECTKGYYDLLRQRQQLTATLENPKKSLCKTGKRIKAKKPSCPEGQKFSDMTPDLRSQIDALMGADAEGYPFTADLPIDKVFENVLKNANHLLDSKCEKIDEFDH